MSGRGADAHHPGGQVLVDPAADAELARVGYVVVPFLDAGEVDDLRRGQRALHAQHDDGLVIDFTLADRASMRTAAQLLAPMWDRKLDALFTGHRVVVSTFVVKNPGPASAMAMHREPTFVDGDARTFNTWVPLVAVDAATANGILRLVPGSERLPDGLVGFNTPPNFRHYEGALAEASVGVDVPAGSALVYDTRMLHWSEANTSEVPRPAIAAAVAPRGVPLVNVVATGRRGRRVHRVEPDFFVDVHPAEVLERIHEERPLVRSTEESPVLTPAAVQAAVGLDAPPVRRTVVPGDVEPEPGELRELGGEAAPGAALPDHDVTQGSAVLDGLAPVPWLVVAECAGASVAELGAARPAIPPEVASGLSSLAVGATVAVVVVDAGGRVTLRSDGHLRVASYEAPELRAGLRSGGWVGTLTPGVVFELAGDQPVTLWNDGPGPTWSVLCPGGMPADDPVESEASAAPVRPRGRVARLLGGCWRLGRGGASGS